MKTNQLETEVLAPTKCKHILLAEDNALAAAALTAFLKFCGHQVTHMPDGLEAQIAFDQAPDRWDLLITDLVMAKASGFDVIRHVRARRPGFPVIVTSGFLSDKEMDRLHDLEVEHILPKPVSPEALEEIIERMA